MIFKYVKEDASAAVIALVSPKYTEFLFAHGYLKISVSLLKFVEII
jgi:hypothetical protein